MAKSPPWQKVAAELAEQRVESRYLELLRRRVDPEQELKALENELAGEVARALGRSEERLLLALAELDLCEARFLRLQEAAADQPTLNAAADAFNTQRAQAAERLRHLVIHREAAGFRRNQLLYELYPIPAQKHRSPG